MAAPLGAIADYREPINGALKAFFALVGGHIDVPLSVRSEQALQRLEDYTMGPAKRIRGSLAAACYDAAIGGKLGEPGLQLGVALELVQSYLLSIDDVMDRSELRRGQPTLQEVYAKDQLTSRHEAEMLAIDIGLLAQHLANLAVLDIGASPETTTELLRILHRNTLVTGFGQLDDLTYKPGRDLDEQDVLRHYAHKSSYYTFVNPLQLGLILAGKGQATALRTCTQFGVPAGIAFQLHDDMLGIFADSEKSGKPNLDDIREGKYTLLMHYALTHVDVGQRCVLETILGNSEIGEPELAQVRKILTACGADEYVQKQIQKHAQLALDALHKQPIVSTSFSDQLRELLHYATTRQR